MAFTKDDSRILEGPSILRHPMLGDHHVNAQKTEKRNISISLQSVYRRNDRLNFYFNDASLECQLDYILFNLADVVLSVQCPTCTTDVPIPSVLLANINSATATTPELRILPTPTPWNITPNRPGVNIPVTVNNVSQEKPIYFASFS